MNNQKLNEILFEHGQMIILLKILRGYCDSVQDNDCSYNVIIQLTIVIAKLKNLYEELDYAIIDLHNN